MLANNQRKIWLPTRVVYEIHPRSLQSEMLSL